MPPRDSLILYSGPSIELGDLFDSDRVSVGRMPDNGLHLGGMGTVSRNHALFEWQENDPASWQVTDLGSKHGTKVNGILLEANK